MERGGATAPEALLLMRGKVGGREIHAVLGLSTGLDSNGLDKLLGRKYLWRDLSRAGVIVHYPREHSIRGARRTTLDTSDGVAH